MSLGAAGLLFFPAAMAALFLLSHLGVKGFWLTLALYGCFWLASLAWIWRPFAKKTLKRATAGLIAAPTLLAAVMAGPMIYESRLASIGDIERRLSLTDYEPFREGTLAASLEGRAGLRLTSDLPRLDGATALYPLYAAFARAVYPPGEYPVHAWTGPDLDEGPTVACGSTREAFSRLLEGEADLVFLAGLAEEQLETAARRNIKLRLVPIGREAFVFFVNRQNGVTNLTLEQIRGIYSGRVTDWLEVGGKPGKIRAYQRKPGSGSQSALVRAMAGEPLQPPKEREVFGFMSGIHKAVADYRNYKGALGFSFRYYLTTMRSAKEIRILSIDGVAPTFESLNDGSYPLGEAFYAVTVDRGPAEPTLRELNARRLVDWIVSPEGQRLVELTGYVPII